MSIEPAWIALIGTLFGGVGLKVLEHWLGRNAVKIDEATKIRDELRVDILSLREQLREQERLVDEWQEKYYDLRDKYSSLNTEYLIALEKIKAAAEEAVNRTDSGIDPAPPVV